MKKNQTNSRKKAEAKNLLSSIPFWIVLTISLGILSGYGFNCWFSSYVFDQKLPITSDVIDCLSIIFGFIILILVACLGSKNSQSKKGRT